MMLGRRRLAVGSRGTGLGRSFRRLVGMWVLRMALRTFAFSSRSESAWLVAGGSIAANASSWSRWLWNMSRRTPECS